MRVLAPGPSCSSPDCSTCSLTYARTCSSDEDAGAISVPGEELDAYVALLMEPVIPALLVGEKASGMGVEGGGKGCSHTQTHSGKQCTHTHRPVHTDTHTHTVGSSVHTHTHTHRPTHNSPLNRNLSRVEFQIN